MKKLLFFILLTASIAASAQTQNLLVDSLHAGKNANSKAAFTGKVWLKNFNGNRPITNGVNGQNGINPGTNELVAFLNAVFYPSQIPTAGLNGGLTFEMSNPAIPALVNINWSYGRQGATEPISSAVINQGVGSVFTTQPNAGASVGGTVPVSVTPNNNTTYTITVTTTDGKTNSASTTVNWLPRISWGRTTNVAATALDIQNATGGNYKLSTTKAGTYTITASGSNRVFIAYPANLGDLTSINIGGLESLGAFVKTVVTFNTVNGYTQDYNVYTSGNETGGNVTAIAN